MEHAKREGAAQRQGRASAGRVPASAPAHTDRRVPSQVPAAWAEAVDRSPRLVAQRQRVATLEHATRTPPTAVVQRKSVQDLVAALEAAMPAGSPLSKAQIVVGLKALDAADRDDINFARALVEFVKARNKSDFKIEDLTAAPKVGFGKAQLSKKWTFRHYTTEKYASLQSLAGLEAQGVNASKNTNERDWTQLGNQGYVFGLVCIDGQVPQRTWLSKMKYYAEYDIKTLPSIWVSGDMLDEKERKGASFQGTGEHVVAKLASMLGMVSQKEAEQIDAKFAGRLEAKVPPAALGEPAWVEA